MRKAMLSAQPRQCPSFVVAHQQKIGTERKQKKSTYVLLFLIPAFKWL
jgi:hypothetical protein